MTRFVLLSIVPNSVSSSIFPDSVCSCVKFCSGREDADALSEEEEGENFLEFKVGDGIPAIKVPLKGTVSRDFSQTISDIRWPKMVKTRLRLALEVYRIICNNNNIIMNTKTNSNSKVKQTY